MRQVKRLSPKQNKVHIIGIGGIGTSALARWFLSYGYDVSGSDASPSEITSDLKKLGVRVFIGHKAKNVSQGLNLAIFSAAIPIDNPERREATRLGIPLKSYAEAVGELTKKYKTLAVSGAHGKSTTTALLSLILIKAGLDPSVIIGTKLKEFANSNFKNGEGDYLVLEADEHTRAFLNYSPIGAIILNIDKEHLDCYKNLTEIKNTFLKFIGNIQAGGILVLNKDDKNLSSLKNKIQKIGKKNNLKIYWYSIRDKLEKKIRDRLAIILKISGEHNVSNALAAYTLAKALKIKDKDIFSSLGSYRGAWRRMEYRGDFVISRKYKVVSKNIVLPTTNYKLPVYDDYAHHPTEVRATLAGIAQKSPKTALICVFQPHQAKRLAMLFNEFVGAFDKADALVILPVFQVKGRDKVSHNINSEKLAEAIQKHILPRPKGARLASVEAASPKKLPNILKKIIQTQSIQATSYKLQATIIMMGAGDIYKLTDKLVK